MTAYAQSKATKSTDAPQALRDIAENSAVRAKETLQQMSAAAVEASNLLKNTYSMSFNGIQDYRARVLEFANANINAAVEQITKLSRVRSPMEFVTLSNEYARQQFEIFSQQAQELAAIVQKMTAATTETVTAGVRKAV